MVSKWENRFGGFFGTFGAVSIEIEKGASYLLQWYNSSNIRCPTEYYLHFFWLFSQSKQYFIGKSRKESQWGNIDWRSLYLVNLYTLSQIVYHNCFTWLTCIHFFSLYTGTLLGQVLVLYLVKVIFT